MKCTLAFEHICVRIYECILDCESRFMHLIEQIYVSEYGVYMNVCASLCVCVFDYVSENMYISVSVFMCKYMYVFECVFMFVFACMKLFEYCMHN